MAGEYAPSLRERLSKHRRIIAMGLAIGALTVPAAKASQTESQASYPKDIIVMEDRTQSPDIEISRDEVRKITATGASGIKITAGWVIGQTHPSEIDLQSMRNAVTAANEYGLKVILSAYPCPPVVEACKDNKPPTNTWERGKFTTWLASLVYNLPDLQHIVIGNEPNGEFGWPKNKALGLNYYKLLAKSYDVLKDAEKKREGGKPIYVYGMATSSTGNVSTEKFIRDVGVAYRDSGRKKPIMDYYSHHPYPDNSSQMPSYVHQGDTIGIADYDRLVNALGEAFDGTNQPGSDLAIFYNEYGIETVIPNHKQHLYLGKELETTKAVGESEQAKNLTEAIGMMACQPNVVGITLFLSKDEQRLERWQSGLYYHDGTVKSSLPTVRTAAQKATTGQQNC